MIFRLKADLILLYLLLVELLSHLGQIF